MKHQIATTITAAMLFAGCAGSSYLDKRIQTVAIADGVTKPTEVLDPAKAVEFSTLATRESARIERELRGNTRDALKQFGRFQTGERGGSDATITFEVIRHGLTAVGENLFAPIVEAEIRATGSKGENLLRKSRSATSGEVHTMDQFLKNPELYRNATSLAAQKLALELAGDL